MLDTPDSGLNAPLRRDELPTRRPREQLRARLLELAAGVPNPALEAVEALAEYSQRQADAHLDEHRYAFEAYLAAGGRDLTPWRAFQAGLRTAAAWGRRHA